MAVTRGQHLIGKTLGTCMLERLLGYGGSSAVFLAQESSPERKVAVKVFLPRANSDLRMQRDFYLRFLHEAESASKLDHPNILPIYSYGEEDGLPYIVMPYMEGGTLSEYVRRRGRLSLQEVQWYVQQLAAALDYAHEHGCVHCDVKPANMLLDREGHVLLSDFGIARVTHPENGEVRMLETVMGTPDYISPEQALGRSLDGRSDVYSLGITIHYLLAGNLPFQSDTAIALALLHVHEPPPSLALLRGDITPALDRVLQKALAKDPDDRYQTAGAFAEAFADAVQTRLERKKTSRTKELAAEYEGWGDFSTDTRLPVIAGRPMVQVRPVKERRARAGRIILLLCACLGFVLIAGLIFQSIGSQRPPPVAPRAVTPTPAIIDLLANNDHWPKSNTLFFEEQSQQYHVVNASPDHGVIAPYYQRQYENFHLQVTMTRVRSNGDGVEYYGVIFRASLDQPQYYLFEIDPREGSYAFLRYDGKITQWTTIKSDTTSLLFQEQGKANTVEIEAQGNSFAFSINGKSIGQTLTDPASVPLTSGLLGLYVESQGVEVAFSQLKVRPLAPVPNTK